MIKMLICDARIDTRDGHSDLWVVLHPGNDAILAFCGTRNEAVAVREALNDLPRQLRATGERCA